MSSIDIHADRRQWMQVFRGIDKDFNHKVSVGDMKDSGVNPLLILTYVLLLYCCCY